MDIVALLIVAVIALWIFRRGRGQSATGSGSTARSRQRMILALSQLKRRRGAYIQLMRSYYRRLYAGQPQVRVEELVYRQEWIPDSPYPLSQVDVLLSEAPYARGKARPSEGLADPSAGYAENVRRVSDVELDNLPLYGAQSIVIGPDGRLDLWVHKGRYFDFYDTCEYRAYRMAWTETAEDQRLDVDSLPPGLAHLDITKLSPRFVGIGVNALTVLRDEEGDWLLLHQRSDRVAEGRGAVHATPAGSFAPGAPEEDKTLCHTVLREFCEEILGLAEEEAHQRARQFYKQLSPAQLTFAGVGLDPLSGKLEALCVLFCDLTASSPLMPAWRSHQQLLSEAPGCAEGELLALPLEGKTLSSLIANPHCTPALGQLLRQLGRHLSAKDAYRLFD